MKRLIMAAAAALILVGSLASPVFAAPPEPVSIVSHMTVNQPEAANTGEFTSTGSDAICQAGTVLDDRLLISGWPSRAGLLQILVVKTFTCDDGSGTFVVELQVHANPDGTERFTWVVQGGTGDYVNLRGRGRGTTVPAGDGVDNTYTGFLVG